MYLMSLQGQATSFWPAFNGAPTECRAVRKKAVLSKHVEGGFLPSGP